MPSSSVVVLSWFWSAKPVPAWCAPLKVSFRGENSTNAHTIVCFSGFSCCFCCLQQVCGGLPDCTGTLNTVFWLGTTSWSSSFFCDDPLCDRVDRSRCFNTKVSPPTNHPTGRRSSKGPKGFLRNDPESVTAVCAGLARLECLRNSSLPYSNIPRPSLTLLVAGFGFSWSRRFSVRVFVTLKSRGYPWYRPLPLHSEHDCPFAGSLATCPASAHC